MKNSWILTMCRKQTEMKSNVKDFFSEWYIYIILIVFNSLNRVRSDDSDFKWGF